MNVTVGIARLLFFYRIVSDPISVALLQRGPHSVGILGEVGNCQLPFFVDYVGKDGSQRDENSALNSVMVRHREVIGVGLST